jgi:hypothetical protein
LSSGKGRGVFVQKLITGRGKEGGGGGRKGGERKREEGGGQNVLLRSIYFLCTGDPYYVLYTALLIS